MTQEMFLMDILIGSGGMLTGSATVFLAMSRTSSKKFRAFEEHCDLKYATKDSQSKVNVNIGRIFTSIKNIEKDIESMGRTIQKKLS